MKNTFKTWLTYTNWLKTDRCFITITDCIQQWIKGICFVEGQLTHQRPSLSPLMYYCYVHCTRLCTINKRRRALAYYKKTQRRGYTVGEVTPFCFVFYFFTHVTYCNVHVCVCLRSYLIEMNTVFFNMFDIYISFSYIYIYII